MNTLIFMGQDGQEPEAFRCRIYDGTPERKDPRAVFVRLCAGQGAVDCPAHDAWVEALQGRGWLPERPALVANPDGAGKIGLWKLTDRGRAEWAEIEGRS